MIEDDVPDEGDPAPPGGIPGGTEISITENQPPGITTDLSHEDRTDRQGQSSTGATAGSLDAEDTSGGAVGPDDASATRPTPAPRSPTADEIPTQGSDPLGGLRREVNLIVSEADAIFKGLNEQIKSSFDSAARAEGYLQRARREVEAAYRRTETAQLGVTNAIERFSTRIQRVQHQLKPDEDRAQADLPQHSTNAGPASGPEHDTPPQGSLRLQSPPLGDDDYDGPPPDRHRTSPTPDDTLSRLFDPRRANESDDGYARHLEEQQ